MRLVLLFLLSAILRAEICPYCKHEKRKSRVTQDVCWVKDPEYDERGRRKKEKQQPCDYHCSNNHQYKRLPNGAFLPQGDQLAEAMVRAASVRSATAAAPKRLMICTIDADKFRAFKESLVGCQRGNCAASPPPGALAAMAQFAEAVECR